MIIHVCGVRGSTPAPGPAFVRYGGHTSCLALAHDDADPVLVLDAGTGIRRVATLLGEQPFRGTILLSHLHWDHTQGLPFFGAADRADARVRLILPEQGGDPAALLARAMSPPHFPIEPAGLRGSWSFASVPEGIFEVEGFTVTAVEVPHKGGRTFGYRVSDGATEVAFLPDHGPLALGPGVDGLGPYHEAALALADGVDVMVHDAQYTAEELAARAHFGHAAAEYAVGLGAIAGVGRLVLFHHDPDRTDDQLDGLVAGFADAPMPVVAAAEGQPFDGTRTDHRDGGSWPR